MTILSGPIWRKCSIAPTYPFRSHFQHTLNRERRARVRVNVDAHQEKKKNENTDKREAEKEEKIQLTDFKEAPWCSSVVQREVRRKKWFV